MRTVRQILLTEYTGAIVVAVLIADSFSALFMTVAEQISYHVYFAEHNLPRDGHRLSITYSILSTGTRIALYLITAYLLAGWLYPAKAQSSVLGETAQTRSENRGTNVTERGTIPGICRLLRRWAPPVIAAWLLHLGAWSIIRFVAEPSVMSLLARTLNWFIEHFTAKGWPIEQVPWPSRFTAYQMADDIVPILIGLLIGWWVLRRKTRIARESL